MTQDQVSYEQDQNNQTVPTHQMTTRSMNEMQSFTREVNKKIAELEIKFDETSKLMEANVKLVQKSINAFVGMPE